MSDIGDDPSAPGWNGHGRLAMTTDEAVAFELKRLAVGTGCHGYGGKCPRPVTVLRGKLRLCAQCDGHLPDPNPLPRTRDPEGEARAKLRVMEETTDGFHLVIDALKLNGIDTIFGLPGIPITDLTRKMQAAGMRVISFRHEQNAGNAAAIAAGEIGRYENTRFVEQSFVAKGGANDSTTYDPYAGTADAWNNGLSSWGFLLGGDTVTEAIALPEEVRALRKQAACVLVASRFETFCLAAVEAMMAGCPLIVPSGSAPGPSTRTRSVTVPPAGV